MNSDSVCQKCGAILDGSEGPDKKACPQCGYLHDILNAEVIDKLRIYESLSYRRKDPGRTGRAKTMSEGITGHEYSYSHGKIISKQRLIDREADKYVETVTDIETGEIIHKCDEPLSEHRGHGTAKKKK